MSSIRDFFAEHLEMLIGVVGLVVFAVGIGWIGHLGKQEVKQQREYLHCLAQSAVDKTDADKCVDPRRHKASGNP